MPSLIPHQSVLSRPLAATALQADLAPRHYRNSTRAATLRNDGDDGSDGARSASGHLHNEHDNPA